MVCGKLLSLQNAKKCRWKNILADIKKPKNNKFTFYHCDVSNQNNVTDFTSKLIKKEKIDVLIYNVVKTKKLLQAI